MLIYVDDVIITLNKINHLRYLIRKLGTCFAMKDLGSLCYFLGLEAHFTNEGLYLTQTKYTRDLLINYGMDGAKPYASPVVAGSKLSIHDGHPLEDPTKYRKYCSCPTISLLDQTKYCIFCQSSVSICAQLDHYSLGYSKMHSLIS